MSDYTVVLLVEQALTEQDARQVHSLHEAIEDPVRYVVLMPVEDAAVAVEAAMGTLGSGELMPPAPITPEETKDLQDEVVRQGRQALDTSVDALTVAGAGASGDLLHGEPVDQLIARVEAVGAAEVIVLTRPHLVSEFFHLDWTSRARRKLGVPVLHLLESETFDEQSGQGEGITGL